MLRNMSGTLLCDNTADYWNGNPQHQYQQEGEYNVRLIAYNGMCNDTITKVAVIKVSPPFAKIGLAQNTCDGTRGLVTFTDGSRKANSWHWDFGDGTSTTYTTAQTTIGHTYTKTGSYKVVLSVTNGTCTVKDSTTVHILLKQKPVLSFDKTESCVNQSMTYQINGLETNPINNYYNNYAFKKWEYSDGTVFTGNYQHSDYWRTNINGIVSAYEVKEDRLRAIIYSSYFNCEDTTNFVPLKINGATAGFQVVTDNVCFKSPVVLKDTSKATSGNSIVSWRWNFGDGNTKTLSQGGLVEHQYANPGSYYVSLTVTDAKGCSANTSFYSNYVRVTGPKAAFSTSTGNTIQLNTTVNFYNNTNTANTNGVTYLWNFGNGVMSTAYSPSYTYTVPGEYVVTLIAENAQTECRDTTRQTITVKNFNTGFTTNTSFIGNHGSCPPVRANFVNTSSNYTKLEWDFGDGFTLENQSYPSHVYAKPGKYIVTLKVYGYNGLTGTYKDTVFVNAPTATIKADDLEGCIGNKVLLNAPVHNNSVTYLWDFGNGQVVNASDSFSTHSYLAPGVYSPSLIVKDGNGCSAADALADKIIIHPNPVITISPSAPLACKTTAVKLQADGAVNYAWSPTVGLSNSSVASPLALPSETTTYTIKGEDANGCTGIATTTVTVPKPFKMNVTGSADVCIGNTVPLKASGANTYQWINTITGLNATQIANPSATPLVNTTYTVVGYDAYKCYSDTANIKVVIRPLPTVNADADKEVVYGSENKLSITNSSDVVRWSWTPADYLSCTNCPAPVSKPYQPIDYIVAVYNAYNCEAKDTISIKAICTDGGIYVPSAFTPNNDGKNDRFTIVGTGVSIIKSLRIYNRWGEIIFEKKDFYPNDYSVAWNGKIKGVDAPAGAYVYFAEMECKAGEKFVRKGTVTLIR